MSDLRKHFSIQRTPLPLVLSNIDTVHYHSVAAVKVRLIALISEAW